MKKTDRKHYARIYASFVSGITLALCSFLFTVPTAYAGEETVSMEENEFFTARDLAQQADLSEAVPFTVKDGEEIRITEEGIYLLSGEAQNATILVDTDKSSKVQLVLDGLNIENQDFPVIYARSADKVFVTTTDSSNSLSVTGSFRSDGDVSTDAVIFSKDDLVLNGIGNLSISSSDNGISSKDDLKITGGTYLISSTQDALEANDSIRINDGSFTIISGKDGLHSGKNDDGTLGEITIFGGSLAIKASSDGIQGNTLVQIDGGNLEISASEGIESTCVKINAGTISINASDDGINAAQKSTLYSPVVEINGGEISIVMGEGDTDAVDANGSIYVNGGTINITARSSFDYDGAGELNGGTVIINGQQVTSLPNAMMGGHGGGFFQGNDQWSGHGQRRGF